MADNKAEVSAAMKGATVRLVGAYIVLPTAFFFAAGTISYWQGWAYCCVLLLPMTAFSMWFARKDPAALLRRFKMREREKAQTRMQQLSLPLNIAAMLLPPLCRRFGWALCVNASAFASAVALALVFASYMLMLWVFVTNRWAGRTVETFDGQRVVDFGPYAHVRHPMYTGYCTMMLATPVALGSWSAVPISMLLVLVVLCMRIPNEEAVLVKELQGYADYTKRVRHRLVPGLW